jgi:hypothetical protein
VLDTTFFIFGALVCLRLLWFGLFNIDLGLGLLQGFENWL